MSRPRTTCARAAASTPLALTASGLWLARPGGFDSCRHR